MNEPESLSARYSDFSWIKVKRYIDDPSRTIEQRYSDLASHHMKETGFLIAEVRKLAAEIDRLNDRLNSPPRTMSEMVRDASRRLKSMTLDEKRQLMIRAGLLTVDGKVPEKYRDDGEED